MINKINKIIHNKYSKFLRFIFFLRYLFAIFIISITLFLTIPNFFTYEKRAEAIKNHILKNYNFEISNYDKIKFKALPLPRLEFKNALIKFHSSSLQSNVRNLKIYPKLLSIYNYKNYQSNKIILKDINISLKESDLKILNKELSKNSNKYLLDNLELEFIDNNKSVIKIYDIKFANFGYKKNLITGKVFGKKFKTKISNNFDNINFKLINSGISADINFDTNNNKYLTKGVFKSKILGTNLKFDFNYDNKKLDISNSYFRNKNLSFESNSEIVFNPFIDLQSKIKVKEINFQTLKKINLKKLMEQKNIIKKINSKKEIIFKSKKFNRDLVDELNLKIELAYGRMSYLKKFSISDNLFQCQGNINLLEEYPLLFFDCFVSSNEKKKLLKKFSIQTNIKNQTFNLNFKGNLSILNKKINFKKISLNNDYEASSEDLKYFKENFEDIVFNESFLEIFNLKKIRDFILEVS